MAFPEGMALTGKGRVLMKKGQMDDAKDILNKAVQINSLNEEAWFAKAELLIEMDRKEEALVCLDHGIEAVGYRQGGY